MPVNFKRFWSWEDGNQTQDINQLFVKMSALGGIFDIDGSQYYATSTGFHMPLASGGAYASANYNWATGRDIQVPADYTLVFDVDVRDKDGVTLGASFWALAVNIPAAANPSDEYLYFSYASDVANFGVMTDATKTATGIKFIGRTFPSYVASTNRIPRNRHTVSVRQLFLNNDTTQPWAVVTVYRGRKVFGAYAVPLTRELTESYIRFGQVNINSGFPLYMPPATFSNIGVRAASETIEAAAVDPGEAPIGGLQRAYEGLYLKYWMRPNGKFKLMRPTTVSSSMTTDSDRVENKYTSFDNRALRSHIRMAGAYTEAEYISETILAQIGYRFEQVNNPYLLTPTACFVEAKRYINRLTGEAKVIQFSMSMNPLLEYEDRITVDGEDWVIQSISLDAASTQIVQNITARRYVPDV